ncbi:MAG: sterol desaturase family protein, partial [Bacteroidota bacterium]
MKEFLATPFLEPYYFALLSAIIFGVVFLRYLLFSGAYHYFFFSTFRRQFDQRRINEQQMERSQLRLEIGRSALTSFIFALSGTVLVILWQQGYTKIYLDWGAYPWWYLPLSLGLALFIHETYYYWLHRWMHHPRVYPWIHRWHHESVHTNSFTSFSFHPTESFLQAIVIPVLIVLLPMHLSVLFVLLLIMTLSGTINHAGVEVYPQGFNRHWLGKWIIGATHHDMHHKQFRYNFGLYFTFWDKWMKTESPKYDRLF